MGKRMNEERQRGAALNVSKSIESKPATTVVSVPSPTILFPRPEIPGKILVLNDSSDDLATKSDLELDSPSVSDILDPSGMLLFL